MTNLENYENRVNRINQKLEQKTGPSTFCTEKFTYLRFNFQVAQAYSCCIIPGNQINSKKALFDPFSIYTPSGLEIEKEELLKSNKSEKCNVCWDVEKNGGLSRRMVFNVRYHYSPQPKIWLESMKKTILGNNDLNYIAKRD